MMTDPIADMLTRIRNAIAVEHPYVDVPTSRVKQGIADVLQKEGYIWDYEVIEAEPRSVLRINLKYGPNGERVISHLERVSKPGRRQYRQIRDIKEVLGGLGISVISTSKGIMSNREAKSNNIGGELICEVW